MQGAPLVLISTHCYVDVSQEFMSFSAGALCRVCSPVAVHFCCGPLSAIIDNLWIPEDN